jgi:hypothetical protein
MFTGGQEAARIDASQNLLVGQTSPYTGAGVTISPLGVVQAERNNVSGVFIRTGSDGDILQFRRDSGVTVGSWKSRAGVVSTIILDPRTGGRGLSAGTNSIVPTDKDGTLSNGATDIGEQNFKFRDAYLSGGVYLGGTGSANKLDDYEEGTFTPVLSFGGGTTSISYGNANGVYTKIGNVVYARWGFRLTNKGSSTGIAALSGFPFVCQSIAYADAICSFQYAGMSNITQNPNLKLGNNSTIANFTQHSSSAESLISDTQFSNATYIYGIMVYNVV